MIQRYFWLAYLVLITLAAALGADMTVSYLATRLGPSTAGEEGTSAGPMKEPERPPHRAYDVIAQRNIFNATPVVLDPCKGPNPPPTCPDVADPCKGPNPPPSCDPCKGANPPPSCITSANLELVGAVTSGDGRNYAFIEDKDARSQQLYQVGDTIKNRTIDEIRDDCVILEQNGKYEQLCFPNRQGAAPASVMPERQRVSREASDASNNADEDSNEDVVQVDDATWRIRRELMQEQFANLGGLAQQARVMPYVVQGETRGFRVTRLKPNSLLHKIGLQHGDVLQKVNGSSITSPAEALQAYQQLQQAGTVRLEILRRNRPSTLTYEIR